MRRQLHLEGKILCLETKSILSHLPFSSSFV